MDKTSKLILYLIGAVILVMVIIEVVKPKPVSWRDSFTASDKIPLGCYVFFNELQTFTEHKVIVNTKSTFNFLKQLDSTTPKTLLLINSKLNLNTEISEALLRFVNQGNTVFLSSTYIQSSILKDSLNFNIKSLESSVFKTPTTHSFTSTHLKTATTRFTDVIENSYFNTIDTLTTTVVGQFTYTKSDSTKTSKTNLIKIPYGTTNGKFIIHTNPFAFTNYHLLNGNQNYAATLMALLPKNPLIWDNNYKSGRSVIQSPLRYILQHKALKWAFYTAMFSLIIFVVFKGKRTQRIIPIVAPPKNDSVQFTKTIGQLYFQQHDFTSIIQHKITYFLEFVRSNYYVNTSQLNTNFIKKLALKSGNTQHSTKALIDLIITLQQQNQHTEAQLIALNTKIEAFKTQTPHG